jgi:murein tripeptide amidase MpaA
MNQRMIVMKKMTVLYALSSALILTPSFLLSQDAVQEKPLTVAEQSQWKATSRFADVMTFVRTLQRLSPYLRVETLATSAEGRDIPLLVIGNPLPSQPSSLRPGGRGIIYIQANIHAGEVEGKEASLMLAGTSSTRRTSPTLIS